MDYIYVFLMLSIAIVVWFHFIQSSSAGLKLPPAPRGLPVIGHLHLLRGHLPHQILAQLAKENGPVMMLRLGSVATLVVSSGEMAREVLKVQDIVFASRPKSSAGDILLYGHKGMAFGEYGEQWRTLRRICTTQIFSQKKLQANTQLRQEEISYTVRAILAASHASRLVNLNSLLIDLSTNIITRMAFSKKFFEHDDGRLRWFQSLIREEFNLAGAFNLSDYVPMLAWLDIQGLKQRMKVFHEEMDIFLEEIIQERVASKSAGRGSNDLLDVLLGEANVCRDVVKAIILDMFNGGTQSGSLTVEWALSELVRSPKLMRKAQEEIDVLVGDKRLVEENDIPSLIYLQAVVKETFRLHPPTPFTLPHESTQECTVAGYTIPKSTRLIVNIWQIGRDPKAWKNATEFDPERFLNDPREVNGQHFDLLPFGSGRRICPGVSLGLSMVHMFLARLIHSFNWIVPGGHSPQHLNMEEAFGLSLLRKEPLLLIPTARLPSHLYA